VPGVEIYRYPTHVKPVYHLYVVRVADRDRILAGLREVGIDAGVHYPVPLHLQPAYAHLGIKEGTLPETEKAAASCLSLPLYPEITEAQVDRVAARIRTLVA
jgi:dTDP-4-amino-4,6-dideoxygalactose transaminase